MFYRKNFATKDSKSLKVRFDKFDEWKGEDDAKLEINQTKNHKFASHIAL